MPLQKDILCTHLTDKADHLQVSLLTAWEWLALDIEDFDKRSEVYTTTSGALIFLQKTYGTYLQVGSSG